MTESTATEAKQSNYGLITSGKHLAKKQATTQSGTDQRNIKDSANKNVKPPGGRATLLHGAMKQSDTPLQFYYTESKNMKKSKYNLHSHKLNSLTVHHIGAKDGTQTKADTGSRCIMEVTVSKPWQAGVGASLIYQ